MLHEFFLEVIGLEFVPKNNNISLLPPNPIKPKISEEAERISIEDEIEWRY